MTIIFSYGTFKEEEKYIVNDLRSAVVVISENEKSSDLSGHAWGML